MKKAIISALTGLFFMGAVSAASFEVADNTANVYGSVGVTSDYMFRGVSQNDQDFSVLSTVGVEWNSFYIEGFAAPVDIAGANFEYDTSFGFRNDYSGFLYDVGIIGYWYPGADVDVDFYEVYAGAGYAFDVLKVGAKGSYSPNYVAGDNNWYWEGYVEADPFWEVNLKAKVGYSTLSGSDVDAITDWELSADKTFAENFNVKVAYVDTSSDLGGLSDLADSRAVITGTVLFN